MKQPYLMTSQPSFFTCDRTRPAKLFYTGYASYEHALLQFLTAKHSKERNF